jgi:hypothetical protein
MVGNPAVRVSTTDRYRRRCVEEWKKQGLSKFEPLFVGKELREVQKIMMSDDFIEKLRRHLLSGAHSSRFLGARSND